MKKTVVALAVLASLLPWLLGMWAERTLKAQLALTDPNGDVLSVSITGYERGWFGSTVDYEIGLASEYVQDLQQGLAQGGSGLGPAQADTMTASLSHRLKLRSQVSHGPVGFLQGPFFGMFKAITAPSEENPWINDLVRSSGMPYLFQARTVTGFFGVTEGAFSIPPISAAGADAGPNPSTGAIEFSGFNAEGRFAFGQRAGRMSGGFERLIIVGEEAELTVQDVQMSADSQAVSQYLWVGPADLSIAHVDLRSKGDAPNFAAEQLHLRMRSDLVNSGDAVDLAFEYGADRLGIATQEVVDAQLRWQIETLSIAAFDEYYKLTQSIGRADQAALQQLSEQAPAVIHQFAAMSPAVSVQPVQFTLDGEPFSGSLRIELDGTRLPAPDTLRIADLGLWAQLTRAQGQVAMSQRLAQTLAVNAAEAQLQAAFADDPSVDPKQLAEMAQLQAPIMLNTLVQQGFIKQTGQSYGAQLSYEAGELKLNGRSMPIGALL